LIGGGLRPEIFIDFAIAILVEWISLATHPQLWEWLS
jgi:hypothetical protein